MAFLAPAMPFISAGMGALGGLFGGKSNKSNVDQGWYGFKDPEKQQWQQAYGQLGTLAGQQGQMAGQWNQPAMDSFLKAQAMNAKWAQSVRDPAAELQANRAMQSQINYMDPMTQRGGARDREIGEIKRQGYGNMQVAGQQRQQQAVGQLGQLAGMAGGIGQGYSQMAGQGILGQLGALGQLGQQGIDMQRMAMMDKQLGMQAGQGIGSAIFGGLSQMPWGDIFKKQGIQNQSAGGHGVTGKW